MEVIDYYYKILEVKYDAESKDVYDAYNKKIQKYLNLPFLNDTQKYEIKELKKAKYVLANKDLKKIYDSIIIQEIDAQNKYKEKSNEKATILKKEKIDSTVMGDRIFSMIGVLNIPQRNYDVDRSFLSTNNSKKD